MSDDDGGGATKKIPKVKKIHYSLSSEEEQAKKITKVKEADYDDPKFKFEITAPKEESKQQDFLYTKELTTNQDENTDE